MLTDCLDALAQQTVRAAQILVVDNASSDGSADMAAAHPVAATVLRLHTNIGGAGGFAVGIRHAVEVMHADAVWLMDDDTVPSAGALAELLDAARRYPGTVDLVSSRVVWTDGRDHPMNTPRRRPWADRHARSAAAAIGAIPIRSSSFVSTLISSRAIRRTGLPIADYFLWNDDFEFSCRLLRHGVGLLIPASVVQHRTAIFGYGDPGERFYFEIRNKFWMLTRSSALGPIERVAYAGSTARRWTVTVIRSPRRRLLVRAGRRGLRDGVARGPRNTIDLIDAATRSGRSDIPRSPDSAGTYAARWTNPTADAPTGRTPFSVLLPVYRGDRPEFLRRAFDSATVEQTRPPDEVVIVQDGPVDRALADELSDIEIRSTVPVRIVRLPDNVGLAEALTAGLHACRHEIVARADADDISFPHRFAVQLPLLEQGADLVGSGLVEFETDENVPGTRRLMPVTPAQIARYARFADPFNHPSVIYRRSAVNAAGGYQDLYLMEDYLLFLRMIDNGAAVANVVEPLVKYRIGQGAYERRGGRRLLRAELALQRTLLDEGLVNRPQYLRNVALRGGYRLVPLSIRRPAYRLLILGRAAAMSRSGRRAHPRPSAGPWTEPGR
jgi:GT2 family glycosyltransferase